MKRQGFTLVELLLTIVVLAVGLTSLFALLPSAARVSAEARQQRRMDRFAETVFASLQSGSDTLPVFGGLHQIDDSGTPHFWPRENPADGSEPLRYVLSVVARTNQVREARLRVSNRWGLEEREYVLEFSDSPRENPLP